MEHFYLRDTGRLERNKNLNQETLELFLLAKSERTVTAYESDWADFCDWCRYNGYSCFPGSPEIVVNYIRSLATYAKANTIARRISALSENYAAGGLHADNPCSSPLVKDAMKGVRRKLGTFQQGKQPLLKEDLEAIIAKMDLQNLAHLRDKTVLLIGFMGAMRRSELTGIFVDHLHFERRGLEVHIPKSKTDQEGQGHVVALPYLTAETLCPVRTLQHWLTAAEITEGPIFRGVTKDNRLRKTGLSAQSVNRIVKQWAARIGLDPADYGAHSLRHGFATSAALAGVEERYIMQQTRHTSVEMVRHYISEADRFRRNPLLQLFG